jgi:serine/threonine protein kinase
VSLLHDNGIIWGDAKADNFMVDANDELWIIDFGGSYTEGWVDPDISETLEGDDMGLEKIQAALEDPDKNTVDLGLVDEEEDEEAVLEEARASTGDAVERLMGNKPEARFAFISERAAFADGAELDI